MGRGWYTVSEPFSGEEFPVVLEGCPRLLMFTGKGGVGKTTCSAAAGIALAARGSPTLLFSTDPAHSLSDSLGQRIGGQITPVEGAPNLWALEIDASTALSRFKQRFGQDLYDLVMSATYLGEEDAQALLDLEIPGIDELMGLHEIFSLMSEAPGRFQHLVWDSAPTGHTLRLLELPDLIDQWVRVLAEITWRYRDVIFPALATTGATSDEGDLVLALKRTIRHFHKAIRDPHMTRLVPVCTPEPMVGAETVRLVKRLRQLRIPLQFGLINGLHPDTAGCPFCQTRHSLQREYLSQLREAMPSLRLLTVPANPLPVRGVKLLEALGIGALDAE